jgi:hypothetical protein
MKNNSLGFSGSQYPPRQNYIVITNWLITLNALITQNDSETDGFVNMLKSLYWYPCMQLYLFLYRSGRHNEQIWTEY